MDSTSVVPKNLLIILFAVLSIFLFYIFWYYLRHLFFKIRKALCLNLSEPDHSNFWCFEFPKNKAKVWKLLVSSLFFVVVILGLNRFLSAIALNNLLVWLKASTMGLAFFMSYKGVLYIQVRMKLADELKISLVANTLFILGLSVLMVLLYQYSFTLSNLFASLLITTTACFSSLLLSGLLRFRENYNLLYEKMIVEINLKISHKDEQINRAITIGHNIEKRITIEDVNIELDNVLYIVSENVYQEFVCVENGRVEKKLTRKTLTSIEKDLELYPGFIRCHRSYIVNLNKVRELKGNSRQQYFVLDTVKDKIPVSRSLAPEILTRFETYQKN